MIMCVALFTVRPKRGDRIAASVSSKIWPESPIKLRKLKVGFLNLRGSVAVVRRA